MKTMVVESLPFLERVPPRAIRNLARLNFDLVLIERLVCDK
jgi:hypothetical protein